MARGMLSFFVLVFPKVNPELIQVSPTLSLVNDCFHFVITFFEIISTSAPHIYRSALPLSPKTSIVKELYKAYAHPSVRVVYGFPVSWEPIVAAMHSGTQINAAAWSPCSRFIAVAQGNSNMIEILDAATLNQLNSLTAPDIAIQLGFSPDSHLLTQFSTKKKLTSWDLQTGGPAGSILPSGPHLPRISPFLSTYSADRDTIAVVYKGPRATTSTTISTYNLLSRMHIYSHQILEGYIIAQVWTHGENYRFAAVKPGTITIQEVGFTSVDGLVEIGSFPAPDNIDCSEECLFVPTLFRLAFLFQRAVIVWDAQDSKSLLNFQATDHFCSPQSYQLTTMCFSPNGHFFACGTSWSGVYLWKESDTGYILQSVIPDCTSPLLSPNGEWIIVYGGLKLQLLRIVDPVTSAPSTPTKPPRWQDQFILGFSPGETQAAVARWGETTTTVFNLKSADMQLIIDTDMSITGLRVDRNTIAIADDKRVITWNLPAGDYTLDVEANIVDSMSFHAPYSISYTSISPGLKYVAYISGTKSLPLTLNLCNMSTGKRAVVVFWKYVNMLWFTPDGCDIWCGDSNSAKGYSIVEDTGSSSIQLMSLGSTMQPSGGLPWQSPRGYKITHDGWILNSSGKQILWLPHQWRPKNEHIVWNGQFLGLLHGELPAAVILELNE